MREGTLHRKPDRRGRGARVDRHPNRLGLAFTDVPAVVSRSRWMAGYSLDDQVDMPGEMVPDEDEDGGEEE